MLNDCNGSSSQLAGWNNSLPHSSLLAINARICGASVPLRPQMKMRFVSFRYIDTLYTCMCVQCVWGFAQGSVSEISLSVSDPRWVMIWLPPGASSFPCSFPCKINELSHTHTHTRIYTHTTPETLFPFQDKWPFQCRQCDCCQIWCSSWNNAERFPCGFCK